MVKTKTSLVKPTNQPAYIFAAEAIDFKFQAICYFIDHRLVPCDVYCCELIKSGVKLRNSKRSIKKS